MFHLSFHNAYWSWRRHPQPLSVRIRKPTLWLLSVWWFLELSLDFLLSSRSDSVPMWNSLLQWHCYLSTWAWPRWLLSKCALRAAGQQHPLHNYTLTIVPCHRLAAASSIVTPTGQRRLMGTDAGCSAQSNNLIKAGRGIHEETKQWLLWTFNGSIG